nr:hypothetical protein [Dyella sp. ASV24]
MTSRKEIFEDLDREKSLWGIFVSSRHILPSKFNIFVSLGSFGAAFACGIVFDDYLKLLILARDVSRLGLASVVSLLGFFITGFSIFATLADKDLLCELALTVHPGYRLSYFKYNFFVFIRVFSTTLLIAFLLLAIIFCLGPGTGVGARIMLSAPSLLKPLVVAVFALIFSLLVISLLVAKTFIANIYISLVTAVQWALTKKWEMQAAKRKEVGGNASQVMVDLRYVPRAKGKRVSR